MASEIFDFESDISPAIFSTPETELAYSTRSSTHLSGERHKRLIRSQVAIVTAILESCRSPNVQHWIMVKARLGYETFWHHMNGLLAEGFLDTIVDGNRTLYRTNAKGLDLLEDLRLV